LTLRQKYIQEDKVQITASTMCSYFMSIRGQFIYFWWSG
jgi:hypothetical protein